MLYIFAVYFGTLSTCVLHMYIVVCSSNVICLSIFLSISRSYLIISVVVLCVCVCVKEGEKEREIFQISALTMVFILDGNSLLRT